jgi:hypothetical protein
MKTWAPKSEFPAIFGWSETLSPNSVSKPQNQSYWLKCSSMEGNKKFIPASNNGIRVRYATF